MFNSFTRQALGEAEYSKLPKERMFLIIWEPAVWDEKIRAKSFLSKFGYIYAPSYQWCKKRDWRPFNWPQSAKVDYTRSFESWMRRINKPVIIQANKFSVHRDEMYSFRRKIIRESVENGFEVILAGSNWSNGFYFNFRSWIASFRRIRPRNWSLKTFKHRISSYENSIGVVADKSMFNSRYRCSVVVENSLDYVIEKLFDAVASGTYVIYVGPQLIEFGIVEGDEFFTLPNTKAVFLKLNEFLNLSDEEQRTKVLRQQEILFRNFVEHEAEQVMTNLANSILMELER